MTYLEEGTTVAKTATDRAQVGRNDWPDPQQTGLDGQIAQQLVEDALVNVLAAKHHDASVPRKLEQVTQALDLLTQAQRALVNQARERRPARNGWHHPAMTWEQIGNTLGVSKQAAAKRFG